MWNLNQPSFRNTLLGQLVRIKSDSATSPDCATRIVQLFGRIAQLGWRNLTCATPRNAQLCLHNFQDCATLLAQLLGLRNSACASAFDRLRNSQDCNSACATTLAGLRNSAATLPPNSSRAHRTWKWHMQFTRARHYQNSHPHGTSSWLGVPTRLKWYQNSHSHGTSNWLGVSTRLRWCQISTPMELQTDVECPQG